MENMVLLRRVSKDLKSTVSNISYSFNKNIYGISLSKEYNNYFICGLLNSDLLNYYYKFKFSSKKEEVFPEIQKYLFEQLPIKITKPKEQVTITNLVKDLIKRPDDISLFEQLNKLVYSLYNISPEHQLIVKNLINPNENKDL
jgi:hypothetical protein